MCQKHIMSPLPVKLAKVTIIVIFFCFAECAAGSCLSYGHACWGAHGKRNNIPIKDPSIRRESQWFLSKLIPNGLDFRYLSDYDMPANQQLFPEAQMESDTLKGQDLQDMYNEELMDKFYSDKLKQPKSTRI